MVGSNCFSEIEKKTMLLFAFDVRKKTKRIFVKKFTHLHNTCTK